MIYTPKVGKPFFQDITEEPKEDKTRRVIRKTMRMVPFTKRMERCWSDVEKWRKVR
jgi:hypothetical protein